MSAPQSKLCCSGEAINSNGWSIAAFTHRGLVRPNNEDAIAVGTDVLTGDMISPVIMTAPDDCCLLMVADGIGGHARGAMASRAVLDYLVTAAHRISNPSSCTEAVEDANQDLYAIMQQHDATLGMGATVAGALLSPTVLLAFNVGDSRCYLLTADRLIQLSHDDVADEATNRSGHRRSHAITQSLGGSSFPVAVETHINVDVPLKLGEAILLCTDGLTDLVSDDDITHALTRMTDPGLATRHLAALAFRHGGHDNISIVVARRARA
ncbi:protein phosphatase 2C domain-containing protein [Tardiphaga sp. P9-11]|uniref:PP2C family protein-serine/threonine phosphatase n=1 Tax=Tardiphaga sp. P9-11 TaxID=2024614 RepID=UPI0011F0C21E|nr:protein phosphatase 2C domain-containing protein [Tardiphaga sp. P9-11]KAA0070427.1 serine/threonine-protein phosphatase [Tardiphaga sp. P9-11]